MQRLIVFIVLILFLLSSCNGIPQTGAGQSDSLETPGIGQAVFPLTPGTCWTYEGTVKWTEGAEVKEKAVKWQMEVDESNERGDDHRVSYEGAPAGIGHCIKKGKNRVIMPSCGLARISSIMQTCHVIPTVG
jgi:hypothetical protein